MHRVTSLPDLAVILPMSENFATIRLTVQALHADQRELAERLNSLNREGDVRDDMALAG